VLLLAGGIGITPLRALLDVLTVTPGNVVLMYRANHGREVVSRPNWSGTVSRANPGSTMSAAASLTIRN